MQILNNNLFIKINYYKLKSNINYYLTNFIKCSTKEFNITNKFICIFHKFLLIINKNLEKLKN